MTDDRTQFRIPEANMKLLERDMEKISRKCVKFCGIELPLFVFASEYADNGRGGADLFYMVSIDFGLVQIEDWTFVARLDHSPDTGNIIRAVPNTNIIVPDYYRHCSPECHHCNLKRPTRRDTFLLHNATTGEFKQVGSTCLVDFLGHDATILGRRAELAGYAMELLRGSQERDPDAEGLQNHRHVRLSTFLAHCAASVRKHGWISAATARLNANLEATRDDAQYRMAQAHAITDEDVALAEQAIEWAQSLADKSHLSDWEHNVLVIANDHYIEGRACGLAASIVGIYYKNLPTRSSSVKLSNMEPLVALFDNAKSRIKWPKINIDLEGHALVLSMAGATAAVPGSINVKGPKNGYDEAPWYGRILRDGTFKPSRSAPHGLDKALLVMASDPAGVAAHYGHKSGQCCMCSKKLTDARSVHVGYGATCAKNWNMCY